VLTATQGPWVSGCTNPDPEQPSAPRIPPSPCCLQATGRCHLRLKATGSSDGAQPDPEGRRSAACAHGSHFLLMFVIIKIYHKTLWHICPFLLRGRGTQTEQAPSHSCSGCSVGKPETAPWRKLAPLGWDRARDALSNGWAQRGSLPCIQQSSGAWEGERKTESKEKKKIQNKEGRLSLFCHPFWIQWRQIVPLGSVCELPEHAPLRTDLPWEVGISHCPGCLLVPAGTCQWWWHFGYSSVALQASVTVCRCLFQESLSLDCCSAALGRGGWDRESMDGI